MHFVKAGTTSYTGYRVRVLDNTTGLPYTGATSATAGIAFGYTRTGGTRQAITVTDLAAVDSAYSSGGMKHIGSGWYRLDLPNAALLAGVSNVLIEGAFTAYVVVGSVVMLTGADFRTDIVATAAGMLDANVVDWKGAAAAAMTGDAYAQIGVAGAGLTALPWAAAWDAEVQSECADAITAAGISASGIAAAVWAYLTASITTASSIGTWIIAKLTSGTVSYSGPVLTGGDLSIVQGDAYSSTDGTACEWTFTTNSTLDWTGDTITLYMVNNAGATFSKAGTCTQSGTTVTATVELTGAETLALAAGSDWAFQLRGTPGNATRPVTPVAGTAMVTARIGS